MKTTETPKQNQRKQAKENNDKQRTTHVNY
jgi:hypothetical protein